MELACQTRAPQDSLFLVFSHSYVLLHHVMGELEGIRNSWGYVEGGMGAVSMAIARAAKSHGAVLQTESVESSECLIIACAESAFCSGSGYKKKVMFPPVHGHRNFMHV